MRRLLLAALTLLGGCVGLEGPRQHRYKLEVLSGPGLSIPEQEVRGRDRLALPEPSNDVAPRTYAENPAYHGRTAQ
jgi:hypothetical protein